MSLADPASFFATPRASFNANKYRTGTPASTPPASGATSSAISQPAEATPPEKAVLGQSDLNQHRLTADPTTPTDQRSTTTEHSEPGSKTPKAITDTENGSPAPSSSFASPSSYVTAQSEISSTFVQQLPNIDRALDLTTTHQVSSPILGPAAIISEHRSFGSEATEIAAITNTMTDGTDMSIHTRLWAMEEMISKRLLGLERELKSMKLQDGVQQSLPLTPPNDEVLEDVKGRLHGINGTSPSLQSQLVKPTWSFAAAEKTEKWMPLAVRVMPALKDVPLAQQPLDLVSMKGFSKDFLIGYLGGKEFAPGVYYPADGAKLKKIATMVNHKTYCLVDSAIEPFAPTKPGEHGAKLAVVMRPLNSDKMAFDVPLFVSLDNDTTHGEEAKYMYLGHYSQTRWSDRLDYDRAKEIVPIEVKTHWARLLADKQKPEWMKEELMTAIWPKPDYEGIVPSAETSAPSEGPDEKSDDTLTKAKMDMKEYLDDLAEWKKEAEEKVDSLTEDGVMKALDNADADGSPGLRFWWEYLQCVKFDRNFYYILVSAMEGRN